ncbi:hypothetical protein QUF72_19330 [Desulfobacterales bacterium HSG2]|nr:hypothetical protein [Desulfobacterales bacterium HSG2]
MPHENVLYILDHEFRILPGAWMPIYLRCDVHSDVTLDIGDVMGITVKLFSTEFIYDFPLEIKLIPRW